MTRHGLSGRASDLDRELLQEFQDYMGVNIIPITVSSAEIKAKMGNLGAT